MRIPATIILGASLALFGCHDKRPAEGPAEYSGRKVDEGAHKTKEGVKEGAHDTKCAVKNAKDDVKNERRDPNCY